MDASNDARRNPKRCHVTPGLPMIMGAAPAFNSEGMRRDRPAARAEGSASVFKLRYATRSDLSDAAVLLSCISWAKQKPRRSGAK